YRGAEYADLPVSIPPAGAITAVLLWLVGLEGLTGAELLKRGDYVHAASFTAVPAGSARVHAVRGTSDSSIARRRLDDEPGMQHARTPRRYGSGVRAGGTGVFPHGPWCD